MARHISYRGKPKKRPNRYNPNAPSYSEAHGKLPAILSTRALVLEGMLKRERRKLYRPEVQGV